MSEQASLVPFPRKTLRVALLWTAAVSILAMFLVRLAPAYDDMVRAAAVAPVFVICLLGALIASSQGRKWLETRVPPLSPAALGVYRVAFALTLWMTLRATVAEGEPLRLVGEVLLALFAVGLASRLTYAGFVLAFTLAHANRMAHDFALPIRTLWLLIVVPWGAGLSVDELCRRYFFRRFNTEPSRLYGLATWIPMLMLGLAYAAAAYAKLDELGFRWITGGAVRYIFLADRAHAPVRLGRLIARSDELSVLVSAAAVATELFVITAVIATRPSLRVMAGAAAFALQAGFYLFQGIWWHAWWALLPAFLPWEAMVSSARAQLKRSGTLDRGDKALMSASAPLPRLMQVIVIVAVVQQPVVSLLRAEYGLLYSDFGMYSNAYLASKPDFAAFAERSWQPPAIIRFRPIQPSAAVDVESQLREIDPQDTLRKAVRTVAGGKPMMPDDVAAVHTVAARYMARFGSTPRQLEAEVDTWRFDWSVVEFVPRDQWKRVASIDLAAGAVGP